MTAAIGDERVRRIEELALGERLDRVVGAH